MPSNPVSQMDLRGLRPSYQMVSSLEGFSLPLARVPTWGFGKTLESAAGRGLRELRDWRGRQKRVAVNSFQPHFRHFPNPNQPKLAF